MNEQARRDSYRVEGGIYTHPSGSGVRLARGNAAATAIIMRAQRHLQGGGC